jgi:predicted alpha-1,6-mannanase (GH76 family)
LIERANSRLKNQINLKNHKLRGMRNITIHVHYCILAMLFVALAAMRIGKRSKVRSITYFTCYGMNFVTG